jgi:orotidine-5'-phosphate decarboxylase
LNFLKLLKNAKKNSNSDICVGLDVAAYGTRNRFTISKEKRKIKVIISLIEQLSPYCCCFKANRQYLLDLPRVEIQEMTNKAHELIRPIIIDHKLSDIGSTNEQAIISISQEGFDCFIFSPFPGNIKETTEFGHKLNLSSIMLVLMSNPEAIWMKNALINKIPFYKYYAKLANENADGAVVGATNHVGNQELESIARLIPNKTILVPGIGAQGGEIEKIIRYFGNNALINIGRSIIYQKDPIDALKNYNKEINLIKSTFH